MSRIKPFYLLPLVAAIGLGDSVYLTVLHYIKQVPECSVIHGCEQVLTSDYASFYGVPVAAGGILFYGLLFVLLYAAASFPTTQNLKFPMFVASVGMAVTLVLMYLQAFVIQAFCQFCVLSAITTTLLFLGVLIAYLKVRKENANRP